MTSRHPEQSTAALAGTLTIILTLVGWASIPLFLKHFASLIDPWTANGWRYAFSAILWAPVIAVGIARKNLPRNLWRAALWPSMFNAIAQAAFAAAPYFVSAGLMTFALRTQIVFVAAGAAILFPAERRIVRSASFLLGMVLVLGGTLGTISLGHAATDKNAILGVSLAVFSGLLYAFYALAVRRNMQGVNPLVAFAAISQYTAALLLPPMLIWGRHAGLDALDLPGRQFALLLLSSLIGIGLGHTFYYFSIARLGVAVSAGVVQLQPFLVAAASYPLFGERLSGLQWDSGVVAISGAAVILYTQHRLSAKPGHIAATDLEEFKTLPLDAPTAAVEAQADT